MTDITEAVARAIFEQKYFRADWSNTDEVIKADHRDFARAAIAAEAELADPRIDPERRRVVEDIISQLREWRNG